MVSFILIPEILQAWTHGESLKFSDQFNITAGCCGSGHTRRCCMATGAIGVVLAFIGLALLVSILPISIDMVSAEGQILKLKPPYTGDFPGSKILTPEALSPKGSLFWGLFSVIGFILGPYLFSRVPIFHAHVLILVSKNYDLQHFSLQS